MSQTTSAPNVLPFSTKAIRAFPLLRVFLFGLLLPLSFAPFHLPGAAILGLALFYAELNRGAGHAFSKGLFFGLGFFGFGTSWVFVSIHEYGHLNWVISTLITLLFLLYLSLFIAGMSYSYKKIATPKGNLLNCALFSALWVLFEYFRATFLSGFPWVLIGVGQFDAPVKSLLPVIGVYGVGFLTCFSAALLVYSLQGKTKTRRLSFLAFILLLLAPALLTHSFAKISKTPVTVGVIQANLSMRNKWDEQLFWQLLARYKQKTEQLLGTQLIVMPESAIPVPPSYVDTFLNDLHDKAKKAGSAIMLGIPTPTTEEENFYFNALISLGKAKGAYLKQHLVPFGEYIPRPFQQLGHWLALPDANLVAGKSNQLLVKVHNHPIATLICYELAYGEILRKQLPKAEWIVSISDDGWFGHSLAMYQQVQMAQVRSLETARYQVVANNDGLSSVINTEGEIVSYLPAFEEGILLGEIFPATGVTPWVSFGNAPALLFCALFILLYPIYYLIMQKLVRSPLAVEYKRRYP
ncbi:MAG: apolipoprotein N-acyltransferase [Tatlockia sp.]